MVFLNGWNIPVFLKNVVVYRRHDICRRIPKTCIEGPAICILVVMPCRQCAQALSNQLLSPDVPTHCTSKSRVPHFQNATFAKFQRSQSMCRLLFSNHNSLLRERHIKIALHILVIVKDRNQHHSKYSETNEEMHVF